LQSPNIFAIDTDVLNKDRMSTVEIYLETRASWSKPREV